MRALVGTDASRKAWYAPAVADFHKAIEKDGKMYYAFYSLKADAEWKGKIELRGLPAGRYRFTATYAGCRPDSARVTVVAGTTIGRDFHIDCG